FPNACAEAFASGLPVFTSPTCGAAEWVRPGENGWAVDALDVAGYRDALSDWMRRRPEWPAMRDAARQRAEPHTLDRMMGELAALYGRLLPRCGVRPMPESISRARVGSGRSRVAPRSRAFRPTGFRSLRFRSIRFRSIRFRSIRFRSLRLP